jgi:hypothetical protein
MLVAGIIDIHGVQQQEIRLLGTNKPFGISKQMAVWIMVVPVEKPMGNVACPIDQDAVTVAIERA